MVCSAQTVHLCCTETNTISKQNETRIPHDPHHLEVLLGVSKMIFEPMVCLAYTVHLSCDKITTISKWTKMSLWYVWCKSCTYHASRLRLSPKDRNELRLEHRHLVVPLSASKMIYEPMVLLPQPCTYLALTLTLSLNGPT
jgi:hypothetical protein